jgi:hypothetical protein
MTICPLNMCIETMRLIVFICNNLITKEYCYCNIYLVYFPIFIFHRHEKSNEISIFNR